jgi:hypothetical protein
MAPKKLPGKAAKKVAKKAAKKVAAKAAKKAAKKTPKHPGNDLRRGFEHLQRLHALRSLLDVPVLDQLRTLSHYAQAALAAGDAKDAAELLRAAEHLAFGALGDDAWAGVITEDLRDALKDEFRHRMDRASERWEEQEPRPARAIKALYKSVRSSAKEAWKSRAYPRALEFARAADALAHVASGELALPGTDDAGTDASESDLRLTV